MDEIYNQYVVNFENLNSKIQNISDVSKTENVQKIDQMFTKYRVLVQSGYTKKSSIRPCAQEHPIFRYGILENLYTRLKNN